MAGVKHFLMTPLLVALATPWLNAADPIGEIDIGLIIEPTASHISGYLEVLAARKGVRSVAVVVPDRATLENSKRKLGERYQSRRRNPCAQDQYW